VHVWRAALAQPGVDVEALQALLSPDELARAQRYRQAAGRQSFIVGRGLLRRMLGHYLGAEAARLRFGCNAYGKPELAGAPAAIHFNVSHSGQWALAAFSLDSAVGVDVECVRPMPDGERVAERFFAPGECAR